LRAAAPFYNWAPLEPFPLLGREFVIATVKQLAKVARHPLKLDEALKAFEALKETPEFFRWYIERYLMYQAQGPEQALLYTKARVHDDTSGVQDLYGSPALKQLQELLGSADVTAGAAHGSR
jgi:hypothetical protein